MLVTPTSAALWLATLLAQATPALEVAPEGPAQGSVQAEQQRIYVAISGLDAEVERLSLALSDAMRRLGVDPQLVHVASPFPGKPAPLGALPARDSATPIMTARLFIDLSASKSVALYVVDDRRERVFVRRFATSTGADELAIEKLVLSAASSIDAILAGQLIGVARSEYEESLRPPTEAKTHRAEASEPERALGSLSGSYGVTWLGSGAVAHGPALGLKLERAPFGLGLWVQGRLPIVVGPDAPGSVQVRLTTLGFRYRTFYQLVLRTTESALLGGGCGADFTQVSPREQRADAALALSPYWAADGLLQGYLGWTHRAASFRLGIMIGVDFALGPVRYVVQGAPQDQLVFEPFRTRPFLELELGVP